jgi:uncharacterized protein
MACMTHRFSGAIGGALIVCAVLSGAGRLGAAATKQEVARAERLALEGDAGAQVAFGILHETGDGVPQNATEASKWFRRAAEQGDAEGCFRLGWLYARGEGLPQNFEQAAEWYEKAANKGHAVAQLSLGWLYFNGNGVARDPARGIELFKRVADHGDANAQYTLGVIYAGAYEEVPKDPAEAARWFRMAAEQGVPSAQSRLGAIYAMGDGLAVDDAAAYFWLSVAITHLSDGAFKTEAEAVRAQVTPKLSVDECSDLEKRAAAWKPGSAGP